MLRRACCDPPTRYERNHRRTGPIQSNLTRKQNYESKTVADLTIALVPIENWLKKNEHELWRENKNNIRSDWKFRRVVEKFEVGIGKINYDAVETSSKNLKVNWKSSTRLTSDCNPWSLQWLFHLDHRKNSLIDWLIECVFVLVEGRLWNAHQTSVNSVDLNLTTKWRCCVESWKLVMRTWDSWSWRRRSVLLSSSTSTSQNLPAKKMRLTERAKCAVSWRLIYSCWKTRSKVPCKGVLSSLDNPCRLKCQSNPWIMEFAVLYMQHYLYKIWCSLLWPPCLADADIIFLSCGFFYLLFFPRLISAAADWMSTILPHMVCP